MRQKTFGKWLAAAGILMAMTIWMVLPALAAPPVVMSPATIRFS